MSATPNTSDVLTTTLTVTDGTIDVAAPSGVTIGGNDSGAVTLTGTAAAIDAALAGTGTNYTGDANYYGPDSLTATTTDTVNGNTDATTVAITLGDTTTVSETVPALSGNENTAISLSGIIVSATPNTSDVLTTTLAVTHGTIDVAATSGVTIGGNDSGAVTLTGTAAAIDAALAGTGTNYTGDANYYGPDSLTATTTDTVNGNTDATTVAITLGDTTTVSETVPALSGNENTAIALSGIIVSATPNTSDVLTTTLAVMHGTIDVAATSGVTIGGNDSGAVTLTGTAAAIDAALAGTGTNYTGDANYYGPDSLTATTTDTVNGNTDATTVAITLGDTTTVSETVPALSGNENTAIALSGISVSATPNTSDVLTTTLAVMHGTIDVAATSGVTIGGNDSGAVTLTGTAAAIDAALAGTGTNYTGDANYYGPDSLTATTTDTVNGNTDATTVAITLGDTTTVSETVPALSGNENTAIALSGISVSATPNTSDVLTTTLAVMHGTIDVAATSGVTIGGNDSGAVTLTGTAAAIDAALAGTGTNYTGDSQLLRPRQPDGDDDGHRQRQHGRHDGGDHAWRHDDGIGDRAGAERQREHRDCAERDYRVGDAEHERRADHDAGGDAWHHRRGGDERRDHRRQRQWRGDADRDGGGDRRGAGRHGHELHWRQPTITAPTT